MKGEIDILRYCPSKPEDVVFVDLPFPKRIFPKGITYSCIAYPTPRGVIIFNAVFKDSPGHFQLQVAPTRISHSETLEMHTFFKQKPDDKKLVPGETVAQIVKPLIFTLVPHAIKLPPINTLLRVIGTRGLN